MRKRLALNERGDTIVEVLISIAVVSVILGGAYVMTNRSLQATRGAQERSNAMKLIESQLETIKSIAKSENSDTVMGSGTPSNFCIVPSSLGVASAGSGGNCQFDVLGNNNNTIEPIYNISVSRTAIAGGAGYTFTIQNTWNALRSGETDRIEMSYRVYQP